MSRRARASLAIFGPGLLLAATGVGAGDLATAAFSGSQLGPAVLWAVIVGAGLKYVLTEGLARWQIATGQTVLEGALLRLGRPARFLFLLYLLPWSWFVGSALISACGATTHALVPVFEQAATGKLVWGCASSLAGLALVRKGGYHLFEIAMRACIGLMFVTVVVTAVRLRPDWGGVLSGLCIPRVPDAGGAGLGWTIALIGGVGGTLTVLCYGYWIREESRDGKGDLALCRLDLGIGYAITALFGLAMVIIGSATIVEGKGAGLVVALGDRLADSLGHGARWIFLVGAFGAVFSSLLGVWQSVPYVFADFWGLARGEESVAVSTASRPYRIYLWALALVPICGLLLPFRQIQKAYAIVGATFLPLLALALLILNGRRAWVGARFRNRWPTALTLTATIVFFVVAGLAAGA